MKRILSLRVLKITVFVFLLAPALAGAKALDLGRMERDDWSGTYFKGQKLGFNHARIRNTKDGTVVDTRVYFRLKAGGLDQATIITQETHLDKNLQLKSFTLLQEIMGNRQKVEGRREGNKLIFDVTTRGYQKTKTIDFPDDVLPASTAWLNLLNRGLAVGKKGTQKLFIEPFQRVVPMHYEIKRQEEITLNGGTYLAYVITQKFSGMESTLWVNIDGTVLKESTTHGFESRLEDKQTAQDLGSEAMSVSSFITLSLVDTKRKIANPDQTRHLKLRMTNLNRPDAIPVDQRQTVLDTQPMGDQRYSATIKISREATRPVKKVALPVPDNPDPEYISEAPEIQSKHPMIRELAKEIVKGKSDAWQASLAINQWVHRHLEKVLVDSFTALDALHNRKGECQSHTNLFVALARSAGIPARVVNGLVYSKQYKGFLYHAWPEVYVGEWRALDPTFGQDAVDATHIKLSIGNYSGSLKLMEFIGRVGIELLDD